MLYLSNKVELSFTTNRWPVNHTYATLGYVRSICVTTNSNILVVYNLYTQKKQGLKWANLCTLSSTQYLRMENLENSE